jgi:uncharacterized protein (DUF2252 family)
VDKRRFRSTDEIVPHSKHVKAFQKVIDRYVKENGIDPYGNRKGYFTVCDVAIKKGSGTASLGLDRFWVLVEGPDPDDPAEARLLELKQARPSALTGLVPPQAERDGDDADEAETAVRAQQVHLVGGDPLYGKAEIEGQLFVVGERSPFEDEIDVAALDAKAMATYADVCGRALAQPHARSDQDTGVMGWRGTPRSSSSAPSSPTCSSATSCSSPRSPPAAPSATGRRSRRTTPAARSTSRGWSRRRRREHARDRRRRYLSGPSPCTAPR